MKLKNTWDSNAFPDAKADRKPYQIDDSASRERERIRKEIYIEQTTDYRMRRHTADDDQTPAGRRAAKSGKLDDLMLLTVGSPAYIEAYNNQLTFSIDGEDVGITQGRLFDLSNKYAENLRAQIAAGRKSGLDPATLAMMTSDLQNVEAIIDLADPAKGKLDGEGYDQARQRLANSPGLSRVIAEDAGISPKEDNPQEEADLVLRVSDDKAAEAVASRMVVGDSRTSLAGEIAPSPLDALSISAHQAFNTVAPNESPETPEVENPVVKPAAGLSI